MENFLDKFSLKGKVAYLTGGLGLIGKEISIALVTSGAKTIILDINNEKFSDEDYRRIQKHKNSIHFELFDITDLENLESNLLLLTEKYGKPDIWINNAYPRTEDWGNKVENLELNSWRDNVDMHMNSYSWISRIVCLLMKKNGGGSLINMGSTYGLIGNDFTIYEGTKMTSSMAYSAIKGGIINLSRYLASYFGPDNVRVNNVCPGGIFDNQNEKFVKNYSSRTPLKRMGNVQEIAPGIIFLASDASSYITGSTLIIDGGWTII